MHNVSKIRKTIVDERHSETENDTSPETSGSANNLHNNKQLPDFIIIGAQKGGTTSLQHTLGAHPDVYMASGESGQHKEIHYFNDRKNWHKGIDWYSSLFCNPDKLQGEKTPNYLPDRQAHARMAQVVPNAKLILSLRNPVKRAYSAWNHYNQILDQSAGWGWRIQTFEQAISDPARCFKSLLYFGMYAQHLKSLFSYYPREQIHIVIAERMRANIDEEYNKILDFLNLPYKAVEFRRIHVRKYAEPMDKQIRLEFEEYFRPHNEELFTLLGEDIPEWSMDAGSSR